MSSKNRDHYNKDSRVNDNSKTDRFGIIKNDFLGADEYKKSKLLYFTGVSGASKVIKGVLKPLGFLPYVSKIFYNMVKRKPGQYNLSYISDPDKRFSEFVQIYDLDESGINSRRKSNLTSAFIYFFLSIATVLWGLFLLNNPGYYQPSFILDYIFPFFPLFITVPNYLKHKYWASQLKYKRLFSFREFISRPSNIIPFVDKAFFSRSLNYLFVLLLSGLVLIPGASHAAFSVTDTLPETDLFYKLLQMLAPIGPVEPASPESPWVKNVGDAFQAFNVTLLTVGSMMLGWHTIAGTIASAYEGQVMGQRWHTIWAPLRVTAGIGSLAPIAKGYCAAQILVIQLIVWGGGIANEVWYAYVNSFDIENAYTVEPEQVSIRNDASFQEVYRSEATKEFIDNLLTRQICIQGISMGLKEGFLSRHSDLPFNKSNFEDETTNRFGFSYKRWQGVYLGDLRGQGVTLDNFFANTDLQVTPFEYFYETGPLAYTKPIKKNLAWWRNSQKQIQTNNNRLINSIGEDSAWQNVNRIIIPFDPICGGPIEIDITEAEMIVEYINSSTINRDDAINSGTWRIARPFVDVDYSSNQEVLDNLNNTTNDLAYQLNEYVLPPVFDAAKHIAEVAVSAQANASNNNTTVEEELTVDDQRVKNNLGAAIAGYQRYSLESLVQNAGSAAEWSQKNQYSVLTEEMKKMGWAGSGAFYVILARMQDVMFSSDANIPTIDDVSLGKVANSHNGDFRDVFDGGNQGSYYGVYKLYDEYREQIFTNTADSALDDLIEEEGNSDGMMRKLYSAASVSIFNNIYGFYKPDPYSAMLDMIDLGNRIISLLLIVASVFFAVSFGFSVFGVAGKINAVAGENGALSKVGGAIGDSLSGLMFIIKTLFIILFLVAVIHAYVLPLMPYILMTFFVMGMLILVAEALIAAPIWAFFHVRLDGQDFIDQVQKPGYMIAFNLLLRPTLAIFGLILSFAIFGAMTWFVNETFSIAGKSLMLGKNVGIIPVIVSLIVMAYLHFQIAIRSFTLITQVPDRVVRWFGQGGENLGEQQDSERSTTAIVGQVVNRGETMGARAQFSGKGNPGPTLDTGNNGSAGGSGGGKSK